MRLFITQNFCLAFILAFFSTISLQANASVQCQLLANSKAVCSDEVQQIKLITESRDLYQISNEEVAPLIEAAASCRQDFKIKCQDIFSHSQKLSEAETSLQLLKDTAEKSPEEWIESLPYEQKIKIELDINSNTTFL